MKKSKRGGIGFVKAATIVLVTALTLFLFSRSIYFKRIQYPIDYAEHIARYSKEYAYNNKPLDMHLIFAMIYVESRYNPNAVSGKDARGLMQLMPQTGSWAAEKTGLNNYSDDILFVPETNIKLGCWYIKNLLTQFNGDIKLVLAAYNGGSGNVEKWLKDKKYSKDGKSLDYIPFSETRSYVEKVLSVYAIYKQLYPDIEDLG